ncbi:hypothetical protein O6H91_07G020800 [Diphasiastrum complanatum]|uniref:Uncharacterized protein n=1 Tax=Diphasiastrum complanatum TaxID=34168 RepID=A0ACC2D2X5_DIPCM|nr:hypothetical protein O6H91_07G020800 [Diphasiastrum complanatum]
MNALAGKADEQEARRDPTVFTSRKAKVWEAKAKGKGKGKGIGRNWKRRRGEELRCNICGQSGHFTQGCPTTLGVNRKHGEVVERIPSKEKRLRGEVVERISLKDKRLRPRLIGTDGSSIQGIERDTGCRIQLEDPIVGNEAFSVCISGPDRFIVSNAVNVVNNLVNKVQDEWNQQSVRRPHGPYGDSSGNSLVAAQMQCSTAEKLQQNNFYGERAVHPENGGNPSQLEARRQWEAASLQSLNGRAALGPGKGTDTLIFYRDNASCYDWNQERGSYPSHGGGFSLQEPKADSLVGHEQPPFPRTLEELEQRFLEETMELSKQQAAEEDRENDRHQEQLRAIHEHFQQRTIQLRSKQTEQRKEFLQHEVQSRQQYQQQTASNHFVSSGGSRNYGNNSYEQYDADAITDVHGPKAGFESFRDSAKRKGNSAHVYHRKQGYETKWSRDSHRYEYDPYTRSSAYRAHG